MTEPQDPLKVIARAAAKRAEAEAVLKRWIPRAYQAGIPIMRIAKAADITRASVYGRLESAGVASTVVKANRWRPNGALGRVDETDEAEAPESPPEAESNLPGVDHPDPFDTGLILADAPPGAAMADAVAATAQLGYRHPFEAAWNDYGEPLMVCKHCNQRRENGAHQ